MSRRRRRLAAVERQMAPARQPAVDIRIGDPAAAASAPTPPGSAVGTRPGEFGSHRAMSEGDSNGTTLDKSAILTTQGPQTGPSAQGPQEYARQGTHTPQRGQRPRPPSEAERAEAAEAYWAAVARGEVLPPQQEMVAVPGGEDFWAPSRGTGFDYLRGPGIPLEVVLGLRRQGPGASRTGFCPYAWAKAQAPRRA